MLNDLLTLLANSVMLPERWHSSFILGCNILIAVARAGSATRDGAVPLRL